MILEEVLSDLDEEVPLDQAIDIIVKIKKMKSYDPDNNKKDHKFSSIIIGCFMAVIGLIYKLTRKNKQILQKVNQIEIQVPLDITRELNIEYLYRLIERWGQGLHHKNYRQHDILSGQWDGCNVIRQIFVESSAKRNAILDRPTLYAPFKSVPYWVDGWFNKQQYLTKIDVIDSNLEGFNYNPGNYSHTSHIKSILPIQNIDLSQIEMPQGTLRKLHVLLSMISNSKITGPIIKIGQADIAVHPGMPLCILCDVVFNKGIARLVNIKWIGSSMQSLQYYIISHYKRKMRLNDRNIIRLSVLGIGLVALMLYRKFRQSQLNNWVACMADRYPRITEVKKSLKSVQAVMRPGKDALKCIQCNQNFIDFIFVPCFHFQVCRSCFNLKKEIRCTTCQQDVYCGVTVYFG